jgi:hypothetical protein
MWMNRVRVESTNLKCSNCDIYIGLTGWDFKIRCEYHVSDNRNKNINLAFQNIFLNVAVHMLKYKIMWAFYTSTKNNFFVLV